VAPSTSLYHKLTPTKTFAATDPCPARPIDISRPTVYDRKYVHNIILYAYACNVTAQCTHTRKCTELQQRAFVVLYYISIRVYIIYDGDTLRAFVSRASHMITIYIIMNTSRRVLTPRNRIVEANFNTVFFFIFAPLRSSGFAARTPRIYTASGD